MAADLSLARRVELALDPIAVWQAHRDECLRCGRTAQPMCKPGRALYHLAVARLRATMGDDWGWWEKYP